MVIPATEQCLFIIRAVMNMLDNNHEMVATVLTLSFGGTGCFPSCYFVTDITSALNFLVGH